MADNNFCTFTVGFGECSSPKGIVWFHETGMTFTNGSRLLQFNQSKSARNVNFIMFLALFTCFYIVYMDVYML